MARALFRGPQRAYKLGSKDVEWLARSLWMESGTRKGRIAAAWAMMHRFLLVKGKWVGFHGKKPWSFETFVRAFSQPVNEAWLESGSYCRPGGKGYGGPDCTAAKFARRRKAQFTAYSQIPLEVRQLAEDFADGRIKDPFSSPVYDWAACSRTGGKGIDVGGNCYLRLQDLKPSAWERNAILPGRVRIDPTAASIGKTFLIASLAVLGGYAGYTLWRRFR